MMFLYMYSPAKSLCLLQSQLNQRHLRGVALSLRPKCDLREQGSGFKKLDEIIVMSNGQRSAWYVRCAVRLKLTVKLTTTTSHS